VTVEAEQLHCWTDTDWKPRDRQAEAIGPNPTTDSLRALIGRTCGHCRPGGQPRDITGHFANRNLLN
jgi:hypothetical protein